MGPFDRVPTSTNVRWEIDESGGDRVISRWNGDCSFAFVRSKAWLLVVLVACSPAQEEDGRKNVPNGDNPDGGTTGLDCKNRRDSPECRATSGEDDDPRRFKIATDLADPDVYKFDDDHFVVSGTPAPGKGFPFYDSSDLVTWTKTKEYNPSRADPNADYCFIWAPDLVKDGGKLYFYFSAQRVGDGAACPPSASDAVTVFRAASVDGSLEFGKPEPLFQGTSGARSYPQSGCPPEGCDHAIRIDPTLYQDRLYYVYFDNGNNIASVSTSNTNDIRIHASVPSMTAEEERINEAPELFERKGKKYMFFSAAFYNSKYTTFYLMGDSMDELTRDTTSRRLTTPVRRRDGKLTETHGHNSITTRGDSVYNFFHMGVFNEQGQLVRRDTYRQRMNFYSDGTLMSQNEVRVSWPSAGSANNYSLGLVLRDSTVIASCMDVGTATSATFTGICPDAGDRLVHKGEVASFRISKSQGSTSTKLADIAYNGYADVVSGPATD